MLRSSAFGMQIGRFRPIMRDSHGAAALEFALIIPVMLLGLIGGIEASILLFLNASVESAVFDASRFGITGGALPGVSREERVLEIVAERTYGLLDMDTVEINTLVYESFADIGQPEPFTDSNANGSHDAGEDFIDVNGNGQWDIDMGAAGLGGPSDVVVYQVSYSWGIVTPFMRGVMGDSVGNVSSVAVRNEPF